MTRTKGDVMDRWEMLENPPEGARETAHLYYWSTNYDAGQGPFTLYLDLIGWSDEQIGEPLYSLKDVSAKLGYLELSYLADALKEYADNPSNVREWVDQIMEAEAAE